MASIGCVFSSVLVYKVGIMMLAVRKYFEKSKQGQPKQLYLCFTVNKFITEDQLPHLLFYGPPGTGKTSTIMASAKQLYTPSEFTSMVSR